MRKRYNLKYKAFLTFLLKGGAPLLAAESCVRLDDT
jgi:hypothetical protein